MDFFHLNSYIQFHNTFIKDIKCYQAKVFYSFSVLLWDQQPLH